MNGNRWVGTGHNSVFRDFDGQWWTAYHAADRFDPYFESEPGFTKRPALLDPIDWIGGWPTVRAGRWASDRRMPAPAAQPGERSTYRPKPVSDHQPGRRLDRLSDEFDGTALAERWSWVRQPGPAEYGVEGGRFRFETQPGDLSNDTNTAPVLTGATPNGDYMVETRVRLDLPAEGCCFNFVQAGLVLYDGDDKFTKLVHVSIFETRQTEFAKEIPAAPELYPRYGNTVVGPPAIRTWLRVVKDERAGRADLYTAYTSQDGSHWVRGGTWTHRLSDEAKIGLVSMGGDGFTATFDYVRVSRLAD
jgi:arabinan endo-1,5-alpha-L-arabinosidase